ncbi:2-octaprenyl-6-methoxyphenyl hydroxylase [Pasteurellaceae bacterium USgator11]|nr:2-octaprenyl-6-methoxyphenyl hydroxylase [Pasteurellaceae bacterium USgator41]TNG95305.1 2-octaprenyl-6-methoxyphenyl hydroxylase [Pasteurellaceae bacterium UScroc12]TNG96743.1 2-octaprenyl-6-methoxyphenyl hydroxylase [Pasteurellaceae bacterium UScroc31]TNH01051.1 2-octaprenyl-6-methoxyphenyl hydroxylase [Pasteurellaceae bacterium USgator11]
MEKPYDLVIVGGAMSGCCLALALAQHLPELRIAVLEKNAKIKPQPHQKCGFDARSIALSQGSCQKLQQIAFNAKQSLWQKITPLTEAITQIHVSDRGHSGIVELSAQALQLSRLGAVVELAAMGKVLLEAIARYPNIDYLSPVTITELQRSADAVHLQLSDQSRLQSALLVCADGNHSTIAQQCGIHYQTLNDYQQSAVIANVKAGLAHDGRAFERFTAQGPLALLPLQHDWLSLVWCVRHPEALLALDDTDFLAQLQQQFGWRLGKFEQVGQRSAYPLKLQKAERQIHHRLALVGNAAQTLHPIAGQGFNLGLRDVTCLAAILVQAVQQGQDLGASAVLQRYQQQRQADQARMINLTDGLVNTFANDLLPLQIARNAGLLALSAFAPLQQQFIKPTLGWV